MSATELTIEQTTDAKPTLPAEIESTGSKLVYLYLHAAEEATIEELRSSLDMKQLALFPYLETLEGEGLVERDGEQYVCCA
jgi:predicted transcriptional regulator